MFHSDEKRRNVDNTPKLVEIGTDVLDWLDERSNGWVGILRHSLNRFIAMRGAQASASLSYYALFSIFPLTLLLASLLGFIFKGDIAYMRAVTFIRAIFPFSGDLVDSQLHDIFSQRNTFGLLGGLGLIWAASGFFTVLANNINLAWPKMKLRGIVQSRLVAFGMVGAVVLLLMISVITTMVVSLIQPMLKFFGGSESLLQSSWWVAGLRIFTILFTYLTFVAMYRWVPNKVVAWKPVLIGALLVTLAWEAARLLFTLYLSSGLAHYQFVYGSLGALMALMVWTYFSNYIALFGAYIVSTLDLREDQKRHDAEKKAGVETETPKGVHG